MADDKQPTQEPTCFVIMPFSKDLQPVYDRIYEPVIRACKLKPVRVDGIFRAGLITKDIYDGIQAASIVLADLTGANPNVYYELGIAHRERKPVILTAQDIEQDIRFDVKTLRVIEYKRGQDDFWNDKLREDLEKAIMGTLADPLSAIATPWLGPVISESHGKEGKAGSGQQELRQILDIVTSLHSISTRQQAEGSTRTSLERELYKWRDRAESAHMENQVLHERYERAMAEVRSLRAELQSMREVAAFLSQQEGEGHESSGRRARPVQLSDKDLKQRDT